MSPGYTAYTLESAEQNSLKTAYVSFKSQFKFLSMYTVDEEYATAEKFGHDVPSSLNVNSSYIMLSGAVEGFFGVFIYGFAAVLVALIVFGSVALIYNSFSISVSERTKQFGLIKSIGATKRQMLHTVLFEAVILSIIAVPIGLAAGCAGLGITFKLLGSTFQKAFGYEDGLTIALYVKPVALVAAALMSVITTLISAYIPAKRAVKVSAIDAIRQSKDITIKANKVKTSRLTYKLFGFSGMVASKNFKRNRKKYRTTVISLFTSIVLFITASSICSYFKTGLSYEMADYEDYDIMGCIYEENDKSDELVEMIKQIDGIDEFASVKTYDLTCVQSSVLSERAKGVYIGEEEGISKGKYCNVNAEVCFVDDENFKRLLKENNLSEEEYMNSSSPKALLFDENTSYYADENNKQHIEKYAIFDTGKVPFDFEVWSTPTSYESQTLGQVYFEGKTKEENGKLYGLYYKGYDEGEEIKDEKEWHEIQTGTLSIGFVLKENPYYVMSHTTLIYPKSAESAVREMTSGEQTKIYIKAQNHQKVYSDISEAVKALGLVGIFYSSDYAAQVEVGRAIILIVNVFSYGFIVLISLIAAANVFNTISTNIYLRRRELAMLKSVGMTQKEFSRMMSYESLLYGLKSLLFGLPVSYAVTVVLYFITRNSGYSIDYYIPWQSFVIAILSVFAVVFASMIYSMRKLSKENTIDALKNENI